ncbi:MULTISPECIES: Spy/CpxP family protein refolding chaperone [unclassified Bradyrhizobium]|uniref:Spy/CpxP family protein refolding chaperone n=1 Tax=unclassified Bradyrhizobium TaxID=2631580 RepID=UPI00201267FD|nr:MULTISPECIES: Spy/CpxP family protein refolding chaperone [unclassified Bradyrhizobium]
MLTLMRPVSRTSTVTWTLAAILAAALIALPAGAAPRGPGGGGRGGGGGFHGGGGGFHGGGFHGGGAHFGGGGFRGGAPHFAGGGFRGGAGFRGGGGFHPGARFAGPRGGGRAFASHAVHAPRGGRTARSFAAHGGRAAAIAGGAGAAALNMRATHMRWSAASVHGALQSQPIHQAFHTGGALRDPRARAMIASSLATVAWHHGGHGWWRHGNGGYGWVGPLFWPFAYDDLYGYALWGDTYDDSFWGYGYPDLYAGLFSPYAYDDLTGYAGYLPQARRTPATTAAANNAAGAATADDEASLARMCGEDSRDIAGLPLDQVRASLQLTDTQASALDTLSGASAQAAQTLKAACPTDIALTAPRRLAIMQQRIEAMVSAVKTVQPPLDAFYGQLSDEQKEKLIGLAGAGDRTARHRTPTTVGSAAPAAPKSCTGAAPDTGLTAWPAAQINATVKPTDAQHKGFDDLQAAAAKAADLLQASACADDHAVTPPARLAAIGRRLDTMLQAVTTVRGALDSVYGTLSDEQKANFDTIGDSLGGPRTMTASTDADEAAAPRASRHRRYAHHARHGVRVERMLRHMLFSFVR